MAQYKVPQDVEAEDKLLGPFTFRQFVYLMIGSICVAAAWGAFQIFPALILLPLPLGIFFIVLALPLRKDQPMETYLAAVISFRTQPQKRLWTPGQREFTIQITAPKVVEKEQLTRDITEDEASHRLSFLANLVDTEGQSIRGSATSSLREEYVAEANQVDDMLEASNATIDKMIAEEQAERKASLAAEIRNAAAGMPTAQPTGQPAAQPVQNIQGQMNALASNQEYSVQTIAAEANRIRAQVAPAPAPAPVIPQPVYQAMPTQPQVAQPAPQVAQPMAAPIPAQPQTAPAQTAAQPVQPAPQIPGAQPGAIFSPKEQK